MKIGVQIGFKILSSLLSVGIILQLAEIAMLAHLLISLANPPGGGHTWDLDYTLDIYVFNVHASLEIFGPFSTSWLCSLCVTVNARLTQHQGLHRHALVTGKHCRHVMWCSCIYWLRYIVTPEPWSWHNITTILTTDDFDYLSFKRIF